MTTYHQITCKPGERDHDAGKFLVIFHQPSAPGHISHTAIVSTESEAIALMNKPTERT